ncbi:MAG: hypothetical protein ABIP06_09325 [Pyrinomonadaceae bacterium]
MLKIIAVIAGLIVVAVSISCKSSMPAATTDTSKKAPDVDFTTPGAPINVKVQLDKKQTASSKISPAGGSVSLTAADGSKFTLDVPANALEKEVEITMTAVKTLDGAPLDKNTPTAVQLEPSGLLFREMLTLTIIPAKEIPIKNQIIFGYEGDGKDYHLTLIDHKSKDIKIKLMEFSGAGVGSGADAAWAANLQIQAETARTRLTQKIGALAQAERNKQISGDENGIEGFLEQVKSLMEQYEDQVLTKEMVAAELDCRFARRAIHNLLAAERQRQIMGFDGMPNVDEKVEKLIKIAEECKKPAAFQIVGGLDDWQTSTKVCDILQPFTLTGGGFTMKLSGGLSGTYSYSGPFAANGVGTYTISLPEGLDKPGTMTGQGEGSAAGYTGSGTEKYTLTPIEPCN